MANYKTENEWKAAVKKRQLNRLLTKFTLEY